MSYNARQILYLSDVARRMLLPSMGGQDPEYFSTLLKAQKYFWKNLNLSPDKPSANSVRSLVNTWNLISKYKAEFRNKNDIRLLSLDSGRQATINTYDFKHAGNFRNLYGKSAV